MRSERYSQASVQSILDRLDGQTLLHELGIGPQDSAESGQELRAYCPICGDRSRMTLVIENDTKRAYCTNLNCNGSSMNSGGGGSLKYYAISQGLTFDAALEALAPNLGVTLVEQSEDAGSLSHDQFIFVEVGYYTKAADGPPQPAAMHYDGQEARGRGLFIPYRQLDDFTSHYRTLVLSSHFRYSSSDAAEIQQLLKEDRLPMLGDYYLVLRANSSSEIVHAINQAIDLVERLKDSYNVPYDAVTVYFAGSEIEVHVDYPVFGGRPGPRLPEIYRRMTCALIGVDPSASADDAKLGQIDMTVYRGDFMSQIAGTLVTSEPRDVYKIRMSYTAFKKLSYQRLNEFTQRRPDLPQREPFSQVSPKAREFYKAIATGLERDSRSSDSDFIVSAFYDTSSGSGMATLKQLAPALLKRLFDENRQVLPSFSPALNRALTGGFRPGELYILAGFPGSGTSTFALQLMNYAAAQDSAHCFFVGLQRGVEELFKRSLSAIGRIPVWDIDAKRQEPGQLYEDKEFHQRIFAALDSYQKFDERIVILEGAAAGSLTRLTQMLRDKREELRSRELRDNSLLLVIDSVQLMVALLRSIWSERSLAGEREFSVELASLDVQTLTGRLKAVARELDVAILATLEYYGGPIERANESSGCSQAMTQLFFDTQFADTVMMLSRQGFSLSGVAESISRANNGGPQAERVRQITKQLKELEAQHLATREFTELGSEFAMLDILKNRTGRVDKMAYVYHRAYSSFEGLDFGR